MLILDILFGLEIALLLYGLAFCIANIIKILLEKKWTQRT